MIGLGDRARAAHVTQSTIYMMRTAGDRTLRAVLALAVALAGAPVTAAAETVAPAGVDGPALVEGAAFSGGEAAEGAPAEGDGAAGLTVEEDGAPEAASARTAAAGPAPEAASVPAVEPAGEGAAAMAASAATAESAAAPDPAADPDADPADPDALELSRALAALEADGFGGYVPRPRYGVDANLNTMIEARLEALGHPGIRARVASVDAQTDPAAAGGVDATDTDANGAVSYFFLAPDQKTSRYDYSVLRQLTPTFELSLGGARAAYTPARSMTLPWDEGRVESYLAAAAASLELAEALTAPAVPEDVTGAPLPVYVVGAGGVKVADVSWKSSDQAVAKVNTGFDADYNSVAEVRLTHQSTPATVTLTATLSLKIPGYGAAPSTTAARDVTLEVSPRSGATSAQIERRLKTYLSKVKVTDFITGDAVKPGAVAGDLQFSRPRDLGLDGRVYRLSYVSEDDSVVRISGYRGVITPSLAGEGARRTSIKAVLSYEGVTVERDLGAFTMAEVGSEEIDAAVALMEQARAGYAAHLLGSNAAPDRVTGDLSIFRAVLPGADGAVWERTAAAARVGGIEPVDLPGYDPMSSQPWRTFRSSDDRVVASESLRVSRPDYDREVTVDSVLTYKRYETLALAHPEDARLAKLVAQPVSATFTVLGTKGAVDPAAQAPVSVTAKITGVSAPGADGRVRAQAWVPATPFTFKKGERKSAWDVLAALLDQGGYTYDLSTGMPGSVTSPDGRVLKMEQIGADWAYWSLLINGGYASEYANKIEVGDGDEIELVYVTPLLSEDGGGAAVEPGADAPEIVPDAPRPDLPVVWTGFGNGGKTALDGVSTPADAARELWAADLRRPGEEYAAVGDPLIAGGHLFAATSTELVKIDRSTGAVVRRVKTYGATAYFSRAVYADGVIVVPSDDGSLAAFTADTLTCVWKTPPLERPVIDGAAASWQASSTLTVANGAVVAPFAAGLGAGGAPARAGALVSVRIADGKVMWVKTSEAAPGAGAGYYWAGASVSGADLVIGDEAGAVRLIDAASGEVLSSVDLGMPVRSTVVTAGEEGGLPVFLAVGRAPATLYKIVREGDSLRLAGQVVFAASSTSTPAVLDGVAFVGGAGADFSGLLAEVDLPTMTLRSATQVARAEVKSAPLVSRVGGRTLVYMTANAAPGALLRYEAGTRAVTTLFTPAGDQANYSTASVIADADGTLYYSNDSGVIFAIGAAADPGVDQGGGSGGSDGGGQPGGQAGAGDAASDPAGPATPSYGADVAGLRNPLSGQAASGRIAPARSPLRRLAAPSAATGRDDARDAGAEPSASPEVDDASPAPASVDAATSAVDARELGMPWVLGALGVIGLVVSGLWFLVLRRRERGEG
ncbi:MAG: hypothetical protein E7001_00965 [Coriobacteriaceae bacterium]|nr:hypothetical protein [Coriobacteriaceae bacterium]